jgi:hypothetical protein
MTTFFGTEDFQRTSRWAGTSNLYNLPYGRHSNQLLRVDLVQHKDM